FRGRLVSDSEMGAKTSGFSITYRICRRLPQCAKTERFFRLKSHDVGVRKKVAEKSRICLERHIPLKFTVILPQVCRRVRVSGCGWILSLRYDV
ncbi:MAG TPA: hypothetical protein VFZ08_01235, partial [Terriglobia bacterium]|nr:hypothetical protein [Terriglobia bacterium]